MKTRHHSSRVWNTECANGTCKYVRKVIGTNVEWLLFMPHAYYMVLWNCTCLKNTCMYHADKNTLSSKTDVFKIHNLSTHKKLIILIYGELMSESNVDWQMRRMTNPHTSTKDHNIINTTFCFHPFQWKQNKLIRNSSLQTKILNANASRH